MKAYWKDIFRTIKYGKKRFFCLMLITALGVTMFTGIRAACDDLTYTADTYYDQLDMYDMNIASTLGLTSDDVEALQAIDGVAIAEGGYELTVYTEVNDATQEAKAKMIGNNLNKPFSIQGELPEQSDEIAVNSLYLKRTGKNIGDTIVLTEEVEEEQDPLLAHTEYVITAVISDPMDVNQSEGNMSWRSTTTVDYVFYLNEKAFDSDVYTYVYLLLDGAKELQTHSVKYENKIIEMEDYILANVKNVREQARYDEVVSSAYEEYYDAEADVMQELADAEKELEDGRKELEDGRKELEDGRKELTDGKRKLADARKELEDGIIQLEAGKAELAENEEVLNAEFASAWAELNEGKSQLTSAKGTLETQENELAAGEAQLKAVKETLAAQEAETYAQIDAGLAYYASELEKPGADIAYIQSEIEKLEAQKTQASMMFASSWEELNAQEAILIQARIELDAGRDLLIEQEAALTTAEQTLITQEASARAQLETVKEELSANDILLNDGLKELEKGERQLERAEKELLEGEEELLKGEQEWLDGQQEYEDGRQEAMSELADAKAEIEDLDMAEWYVQTRNSLSGYANVDSDASSIKGIGTFLSIIFFIVAILVSLTTITRMVEEDRGLIGTYKALGFTNREIRRKAVVFSASACLAGGVIGDIGGFVVLPKIIIVIFHTMYTFPAYTLRFDWFFGILGIALFVAGVSLSALWSCTNILREMPATLMRPQAPKSGSRIFLERIPALWSHMSFLNKVTARNLFRYKKRLIMTVFGIMGCTALLVCGFGIKNTVTDFMPKQYENTYEYDVMAVAMPEDNEQLLDYVKDEAFVEDYINVQIESIKLKNSQGREESVQMIVVPDGTDLDPFIHLHLKDDSIVDLSDEGIIVTRNVSQILNFEKGDTITIRDIALNEDQAPVTEIVENYLGNMVYVTEHYYEEHFKDFEANGLLINLSEDCQEPIEYAAAFGEKDGVISCISNHSLRADFSQAFALMNLVVYVVIVLAAGLAFVVLFTLATTNISERSRELATIKVLGFFDKEVHLYVNKETLILSVVGILVGLPVGVFLTYALGWILHLPGINFDISIFPSTYLLSAVIAFVFTLIVNQITNRLLDVIDPVEALKSVE